MVWSTRYHKKIRRFCSFSLVSFGNGLCCLYESSLFSSNQLSRSLFQRQFSLISKILVLKASYAGYSVVHHTIRLVTDVPRYAVCNVYVTACTGYTLKLNNFKIFADWLLSYLAGIGTIQAKQANFVAGIIDHIFKSCIKATFISLSCIYILRYTVSIVILGRYSLLQDFTSYRPAALVTANIWLSLPALQYDSVLADGMSAVYCNHNFYLTTKLAFRQLARWFYYIQLLTRLRCLLKSGRFGSNF